MSEVRDRLPLEDLKAIVLPAKTEAFVRRFRRSANGYAAAYGAPVYLVGGALDDEDPRDFDVRIVVSFDDFLRLFCNRHEAMEARKTGKLPELVDHFDYAPWEWRRGYEDLKRSRWLSNAFQCRVDFQIQTLDEAYGYYGDPRLRIDTAPDWLFRANRKWEATA